MAAVSEVGRAGHPGSGLPQPWPELHWVQAVESSPWGRRAPEHSPFPRDAGWWLGWAGSGPLGHWCCGPEQEPPGSGFPPTALIITLVTSPPLAVTLLLARPLCGSWALFS